MNVNSVADAMASEMPTTEHSVDYAWERAF